MKKNLIVIFCIVILIGLTGSYAMAAKPVRDFTEWSNGFPSGEHFNLNIHGKKLDYGLTCDNSASGGNSVFVPEYGNASIQIIQNKKSTIENLTVLDPCSFNPDDPAKVLLPKGEYQVYVRILAKPGKVKNGEKRNVTFYPNLIEACNDTTNDPEFGNYTNCSLGLGIITGDGAFVMKNQTLERIVPVGKQPKKNRAVDITEMFTWTGCACNESYNSSIYPNPADDTINCTCYENEWIFNIADLVVYGWDYENKGAKLVQVRFYPIGATKFT